ncbi:chromatin modification-related protein EAF1 B-like isoform X1 [Senna tora]|uniref:Chromatin modification-related protein EAF1 B-like isoform X1 n=1 Tax=Senna tora TaxID=362788 RepID=A0A834WJQ0_9FABA|nr:chromatin modification-related protein EAF1 B-like isoform X1 [Senna tora]
MHGCNSGTALLVNAEVDSMGGVIDGGVGIGLKTSPRRAAIEKAQAELRQEYDVREERRRELEFLEKGGNPLDFKFGNAASASVQSTSLTDQHHEQFGTSEAKGSFALTASPHGDSVDSSARPGAPSISEPNTADNLLIFDGENELPKGERRSQHQSRRNNIPPSEQSSQIDGSQNAKESEDSAIFRPYSRRRSKTSHGPRGGSRDGKGLVSETSSLKDHNLPSVSKPKPPNLNGDMITKDLASINPLASKLDGVRAHQTASGSSVPEVKLDISVNKNCKQDQCAVPSQDDTVQNPVVLASGEANAVEEREPVSSADLDSLPVATSKPENETCSGQPNGFGNIKVDRKGIANQGQNNDAALGMMNFNSESSCTQTSLGRDVNNDSDMCNSTKNVTANGITGEQASEFEKKVNVGFDVVKERMKTNASGGGATVNNRNGSGCQSNSGSGNMVKGDENMAVNNSSTLNKEHDFSNIKEVQQNDSTVSKTDKVVSDVLVDHSSSVKGNSSGRHHQGPLDVSNCELPRAAPDENVPNAASDCQPCSSHHLLADKAHEDSTLEEARIIEAKRKRIAELSSIRTLPTQNHRKSHWGFVLEEMAWLANDFAQERLWKITAAAQLCHRAAFTSRLRFEEQNKLWGIKVLAHSMAKAVMQFWRSVELLLDSGAPKANCPGGLAEPGNVDADEASRNKRRNSNMETSKDLEEPPRKNVALKVQAYALRFLKYSSSHETFSQAEAPSTPDRISDSGTLGMPWDEHLTEENLFYTAPSSAMETYRKSVEYHFLHFEKTGSSMQEEVETSIYDTAAEFGSEEHAYDEDDGETNTYYLPGVYEGSKPSKSAHKKHKNLMKSYTPRPCEVGADLHYGNYATGSQPSIINGKRPASLNVGPITKRMRTASRQRVVSPFTAGVTGTVQAQVKTDASSGDTNSFQDDQSTLHGGSQIQKSVEVESIGEFERQLPYDCAETSVKTKKKKKAKNLGSAYDQGWQVDSVLNEQRDHSKRRLESHHFEPNGSSGKRSCYLGLYVQHTAKKPKTMKISLDNTFDVTTMNGSIPSPAASQMSNPSKFIKIISGRDRGRKAKSLKISAGQPGSGSPWSLFEDQALVVLVHDMGPNWELVSDAINSTLQFKCIFRKPKECKDRHKILMDRSAGDGADSAEDSGSSQSYPSTLPGIPKGSARQLFQRLQGPMEEDTLKSHFENIIKIGQKQYYRRNQNDIQDLKQIVPVHNSHVMALAQVCPNNLNGGLLTPLDLCDTNAPTPDALPPGYQSSHAGGLALSSQGSLPSIHPTSGANSSLPGSSGMVHGNNLSSPSGPMTASVRDIRYGVPRTSPLSVDEQQRMQYSQMISGRNIQQSSMSLPGSLSGSDRGVRMLQGGNGMGMMCGMNRSMGISRPGLQGMAPSSMLNSGNMLSSSMVGMPSPVNMHSGVGTGQGNSMLRPREALHMMRPGHNPEQQRQMMVPDLPMQASQGNSQGIPAFNGLSSAFNNQTTPPPVQPYPGHSQQPHQMSQQQSHLNSPRPHLQGTNHSTNSPQQALAIRIAKERQMQQHQQRYLQQQNQPQFAASNTLMPHVQAQSQIPISSPPQNSSQIQSQNSSAQVSASPVTSSQHPQQKHHLPQHGFNRNPSASGLTNQAAKQRQRQTQQQQYQQPGRQHPNQRQHVQSQQQAKLLKGIGRGNMLAHQNISVDSSHLNGLSTPLTSQNTEKGDPTMHIMQGQNLYPESGLNSNQPSKPLASAHSTNHSQLQQKLHSVATTTSSKQHQPMISAPQSGPILPPSQPAVIASNHHPVQLQSHSQSKQISQTQSNVQRMLQQNRLVHSESPSKSQSDQTQVDRQSANNTSEVSTSSAMTQGRVDSANVVSVPADSSQWKTSESSSDSSMPNKATQVGSLGSAPVGNSAGKEHLPPTSQGLCSRQLPVNLPSHSHNSGAQWSQQPLPSQQSSSQPTLSQQQYKPQEQQQQKQQEQEKHSPKHVALQHQSQQQVTQGQSSLFIRPPNSRVE